MARKKKGSDGDTTGTLAEVVNPGVNPAIEHTRPEHSLPFPIVAVGASAGGIEAATALFKALPADTGMAFVLIQHLSPTHESLLPEILGRATAMKVMEVREDGAVEPNRVYVIPPNKHLAFGNGRLHLSPRVDSRGQPRPIDHFMRSLAEEHGHKAIGVVLSGSANDGTLGLEEIKSGGGITFAQDSTAEQPSMPRSAVAAGSVDFVLPPDEIAHEISRIAKHPYVAPDDVDPSTREEPVFGKILELLRAQTGVDFSNYKRNTLHRRITRRMVLHRLDGLPEYLRMLQEKHSEVQALYQDVLINVTSFFRNPDSYEALKTTVFPKLTESRGNQDPLRVWALGCSTGEEAYSLAMTFVEYLEAAGRHVPMQVFATDVNGTGIERARSGFYPKGITQDVSPERLRRFFTEVDGRYRISKQVRDMCVFARQNALSDPPFSRLDLVACRNMLIYLEPVLQQRLIPLLHYALRQGGFLWLGGSETIGSYRELFDLQDAKHKIYLRKSTTRTPTLNVPVQPSRWTGAPSIAPVVQAAAPRDFGTDAHKEAERLLLTRYAPPGVVVNDDLEVVQFRGDTGAYLAPAPGKATLSLLKMLREGLSVAVRNAVQRARRERDAVREEGLRVRSNGGWREVDLVVMPLRAAAGDGYLILFEEPAQRAEARAREMAAEARAAADRMPPTPAEGSAQEVTRLTQELSSTREYLQSVIEQQEAANEELQSANEEVQSANEELQSINEELETSKEEIQSSNEELATVNDELQSRNTELSRSNNDLTNLLASVNMAIVMLGSDLRIRRFTQPAEKILNLIATDVGRPLTDIKLSIDAHNLDTLIADVIDNVNPQEREVRDRNGRWHLLRVRPYRTADNHIDGAVLVLMDIDGMKRAEQSMRESEERFELLANSSPVLIWTADLEGCRFVNRAFEEFVGQAEADICRSGIASFVHPEEREAYADGYARAIAAGESFSMRLRLRRADGTFRWVKHVAMPRIVDRKLVGYVGSSLDITDLAQAEEALLELDRGKNEFLALLGHEMRNPLSGVHNAGRILAESRGPEDVERARAIIDRQSTHMLRMIDDLLDISRITYGKIQLEREAVDVAEVLRRAVQATAEDREELGHVLTVSIPEDRPLWVDGDPGRLEQVFINLLGNATKFTRGNGRIWVSADVEPGTRSAPAAVAVRVRDNGMGIDHTSLQRIFDLFVQGGQPTERARTGIGLGLTLAKRLIDLHGGTIEAHSAGSGMGSEFIVRLRLIADPPARKREARSPRSRQASGESRRVLIVDDNDDSATSLETLLTMRGHHVKVVDEGGKALTAALEMKADAVLLDIGLPDMDGREVASLLRANPRTRDALIVAVSGFARDSDRDLSLESGIDAHLAKPADLDKLLELLARGRN